MTGKDQWRTTTATVYSSDWRGLSNQVDSEVGFYDVIYSYSVDGIRYAGKFSDYGMEDEDYFKRNDTFEIRYNPADPAKSYYPNLRTRNRYLLVSASIGALLGILALMIRFFISARSR